MPTPITSSSSRRLWLVALVLPLALAACGAGGEETAMPSPTPTPPPASTPKAGCDLIDQAANFYAGLDQGKVIRGEAHTELDWVKTKLVNASKVMASEQQQAVLHAAFTIRLIDTMTAGGNIDTYATAASDADEYMRGLRSYCEAG